MKKVFLISVLVFLGSAIALGVCEAAPVIKLIYTDHNPPQSWGTVNGTEPWLNQIEKATNGRVKVERYYAQTLVKGTDAWMALKTGVADIAWCAHGYWAGMTPLANAVMLPFLPFKSGRQASGILWKLTEKYPQMGQEFADAHVLLLHCTPPFSLVTTKKQVKTMEDLKGLKLRVLAGPPTDALKALGVVPAMIGMSDVYIAMQKGTIDGMGMPLGVMEIFNLYEVVKYWTHVPLYTAFISVSMSKATWNSLPSDIQKAIMSLSAYEGSRTYAHNYHDSYDEPVRKEMDEWEKKGGQKVEEYVLPKDELDRWIEVAGKPVWDRWVESMEAKGLPARDVLADMLKLIESEPE